MPDPLNIVSRLKSGGIVRAFRHRDFAIYSIASWCSDNGMWMMRIGMGWLTWDLTHSGAWLGSMVLAQALPSVFLVPFAGAMADRCGPNCLLVEEGKLLHRRDRFHVRVVFDNGRPHGVCDEALVVVRNTWSR